MKEQELNALSELKEKILKSIKLNQLFTVSDNHFGHNAVFEKYEPIRMQYTLKNRGNTLQDFENLMIKNWNAKVSIATCVLHLGDFCINKMDDKKTLLNISNNTKKLHGFKILIKGNHDKMPNEVYLDRGWNFVVDKPTILLNDVEVIENAPEHTGCIIVDINNQRVMFSHFGIHQYDDRFEGKYKNNFKFLQELYKKYNCTLNIHGHSHSNAVNSKVSFNVSVEAINFTPKSYQEIIYSINQ